MRKKIFWLVIPLVFLFLLTGCKVRGNPLPEGMEEETVLTQGREVVSMLNEGNCQGVYDLLRSDAQEGASLEQFEAAVAENLDKAGAYERETEAMTTGQTIKATGEAYATAVLYCRHEKKSVIYRVAYSVDMELLGVEVKIQ